MRLIFFRQDGTPFLNQRDGWGLTVYSDLGLGRSVLQGHAWSVVDAHAGLVAHWRIDDPATGKILAWWSRENYVRPETLQ